MQPTYFTELMLTEIAEFREKQEPELTWFLPAISKCTASLPLVTYHGEFISCLSTLVKSWNELNCYKKVKIRNAKSRLMQLIKSHLCSLHVLLTFFSWKLSSWSCVWCKNCENPSAWHQGESLISLHWSKWALSSDLSNTGIILIKLKTWKLEFHSALCWV